LTDINQAYKVRADYQSRQYWSETFTWANQTIDIKEGQARIEVKQGTTLLDGVKVYVFNDQNQYQGTYETTDANGLVSFRLPQGTYKFRADYLNNQYWASTSVTANDTVPVAIDTGGAVFNLLLEKQTGQPISGIKVYAFSSAGSYLGLNDTSDESGMVSFDLPDGEYKFRADYSGYQFWSEPVKLPETSASVLTIPHQDVAIAVNSQYEALAPIQEVNVYLFTESGTYQGKTTPTDGSGIATFNVPNKTYKVRADYLSKQYWSDPFTGIDTNITIDHATANLHVTMAGAGISGARVYLFSESGSYLSRFDNTNDQGKASFFIPQGRYKFRVDHNGSQYWSEPMTLVAFQENTIDMNLDLLASNLTANPFYARYDGVAPEKPKLLLASIGSEVPDPQIDTGSHAIYFFINDHFGTPLKVMDSQGQVVWSADYTPFGQARINNSTIENGFRFPGQYYDGETGLHYNWHRYYDPTTGRYMTPDPIGLVGGVNPFLYVLNNPVNKTDP